MKYLKLKNLCLCFLTGIIAVGLANCSWSSGSDKQPPYIKASLSEGKANFKAKNYAAAYRQLLPLAVKGNKDAQYAVGYMYYYGKGIDQNEELAENWLRRAAKQKEPHAITALEELSHHKNQTSPDNKEPEAESENQ